MSVIFPRMQASLEIETELSLQEVAHQVGLAVGVTFKEDVEGVYEEVPALVAVCMGHMYGMYTNNEKNSLEDMHQIYLDIRPSLHPIDIGLKVKGCEIIRLDLSHYVTALLNTKTGLTFKALSLLL